MFLGSSDQEDEGDVPLAQRKRFTRVEMARVLMERNQVFPSDHKKWDGLDQLCNYWFAVQGTIHGVARGGAMAGVGSRLA